MANVTNDLLLEHLKRLQLGQSDLKADMLEVKQRLGFMEESLASLSRRADRMSERVERIERRLDLAESAT